MLTGLNHRESILTNFTTSWITTQTMTQTTDLTVGKEVCKSSEMINLEMPNLSQQNVGVVGVSTEEHLDKYDKKYRQLVRE